MAHLKDNQRDLCAYDIRATATTTKERDDASAPRSKSRTANAPTLIQVSRSAIHHGTMGETDTTDARFADKIYREMAKGLTGPISPASCKGATVGGDASALPLKCRSVMPIACDCHNTSAVAARGTP